MVEFTDVYVRLARQPKKIPFDLWTRQENPYLTHWSRDKMAAILQTTFSKAFTWIRMWIPMKFSMKFAIRGLINNISVLVQIMAWRRQGDKPLSEPMTVSLPTHIYITRFQWVNFEVRIAPADGITPSDAITFADTVMTKSNFHLGQVLGWLTSFEEQAKPDVT